MRRSILLWLIFIFMISGCDQMPLLNTLIKSSPEEADSAGLQDDFSDKKSGWEEIVMREGSAGYSNNVYQITVNHPNTDIFSTYTKTFIDSGATVQVVRAAGADDNNFGVICRFQDPENFYAGQISSDGTAGIFKVVKGKYQLLGNPRMISIPAILGGNGKNKIRFDCFENTLTLTVNGELADSQEDDTFNSGEIGLIAGVLNTDYGVFQFDDLSVIVK